MSEFGVKTIKTDVKQAETLISSILLSIREELRDNSYIVETLTVLPVGGYRSAIGSIWNAVVDDLRNKVIHRSVEMFNKEMTGLGREIKTYEDFQNYVNDDQLLEGAYKLGIISWEAQRVLKQAKETRHIFDGHPKSTTPTIIKVLGMIEDSVKYVLSQDFPQKLVDIDKYLEIMEKTNFDRNTYVISNMTADLPDRYKEILINKLFTFYIDPNCSAILRSNIEFVAPILWQVLQNTVKNQVCTRVDREILSGNKVTTDYSLTFINLVEAMHMLSTNAKKYVLEPIITKLNENIDQWSIEAECVSILSFYAGYIPRELIYDYVNGITQSYIGYRGYSYQFNRTDFFSDSAASYIPKMFTYFDDESTKAFVDVLKTNKQVRSRLLSHPNKISRLRILGNIVIQRISDNFPDKEILELLIDEQKEKQFFDIIGK